MIVAIALNDNDINAIVPPTLEEATGLLFVEADTLECVRFATENWVHAMDDTSCEAILCGDIMDPHLFEDIAGICVTRYHAGGLSGIQAIKDMDNYRLAMITDYVGGSGCGGHSHTGECNCGHENECDGDCGYKSE